jgi:hypothetical protein
MNTKIRLHTILLAALLPAPLTHAALADDTADANRSFVVAVRAWNEAEALKVNSMPVAERRAEPLGLAAGNLHGIINDYPSADLAVKLVSGERVGPVSGEFGCSSLAVLAPSFSFEPCFSFSLFQPCFPVPARPR